MSQTSPLWQAWSQQTTAQQSWSLEIEEAFNWLRTHAGDLLLDPTSADPDTLKQWIWKAVASRNLLPHDADRLTQRLFDQLTGAGVLTPLFYDPSITEIMVVDTHVYIERQGRIVPALTLASSSDAIRLAEQLCHHCHVEYQTTNPLINLTWPENGARINIVHHVLSPTGVAITIRKRNEEVSLQLVDLIQSRAVSEEAAILITEAARSHLNLLFAGTPGSGKTTLLRAFAQTAIDPTERVIVLEDTEELRLQFPHMIVLIGQTDDPTPEERRMGIVTIHELFRNTLRQRFDRLLVGEVRGIEAFDMLQAAITGEGGIFSTIHLRTPHVFLERLLLIAERYNLRLSMPLLERIIPKAIDFIIQVERDGEGHRHISEIVEHLPDGRAQTLYAWNPQTHQLESRLPLADHHRAWMQRHQRSASPASAVPEWRKDLLELYSHWDDVVRPAS
ncbi:component of type IV pilus [Sulfobacillus acidophilus TPY]|uniref:Type II secretion system protein E n=1 Tax=Sulfobacillus acidophilus (strain ATCC 700253 / DSM 10332 / NAL) TaxID=679936 RepID=G8TV85_SULAD|nr:component of type IV pilus [Sulfobacillus acidophilus TPY]AEW04725.1 type II secretion system protein E [Sulfobacillus acidophilus DSM 10332]